MSFQFLRCVTLTLALVTVWLAPAHAQQAQPGLFESLGKFLAPAKTAEDSAAPTRGGEARGAEKRNLGVAPTGRRIALVIGNDAYQRVSKLEKAGNDATAMARELKAAGFEVLLHHDLNYRGMVKAVETLANSITGGDQVVVFFAGHGVQIKTGSYLLPVDIEASSESEVEKTAYGLADLTDKLQEAKASFALVMVDACRDNPLKSKGRSIGATRGLSAIEPPKGQMVVYSASKGQQALDRLSDGDLHPNGVFTREFVARMKRPGLRIQELVVEVQDAVEELARTVSHDQRPAIYNEARGNFYFFGAGTQVAALGLQFSGARTREQIEDELWDAIKGNEKASVFEEYLKQFPNGRYLAQVRVRLAELKEAAKPAPVAVPPAPTAEPPKTIAVDAETDTWNEVKKGGTKEYFDAYLKDYPKGKYAGLAKAELKKLGDRDKAERAKEEAERKAAATRGQQEARQAEQDVWERAKAAATVAAYADYLGSYPQGRYASLAQAARQKIQRDEAEREQQETARREREAREAEKQRLATERDVAERARQEQARLAKEAAEMRPGKVFKDCADCPEMVILPAGSFEMGSPSSEMRRDSDEGPQHRVSVRSFAAGKFEVTRGQFAAFVRDSGHSAGNECFTFEGGKWEKRGGRNWQNPGYSQADSHPAVCVSWDDAKAYVAWLSRKSGKSYRLFSEAEWEYATRAGTSTARYWGESPDQACGYANIGDQTTKSQVPGWTFEVHNCTDGHAYTAPAGSFKPNAFGLYDMIGNAWEWTEDCWNKTYSGTPSDGSAWTTGECSVGRVLRGGSWDSKPQGARAASRGRYGTTIRGSGNGFRLARMLP